MEMRVVGCGCEEESWSNVGKCVKSRRVFTRQAWKTCFPMGRHHFNRTCKLCGFIAKSESNAPK